MATGASSSSFDPIDQQILDPHAEITCELARGTEAHCILYAVLFAQLLLMAEMTQCTCIEL